MTRTTLAARFAAVAGAALLTLSLGACGNAQDAQPEVVQEANKVGLGDQVQDGVAIDGQNLFVRLGNDGFDNSSYEWTQKLEGEGLVLAEGPVKVDKTDADGNKTGESWVFQYVGETAGQQTIELSFGNEKEEAANCTIQVQTNADGDVTQADYEMSDGRTGSVSQ